MKVSEYNPMYGLLFNFEYQTGIDGKSITVNELFEEHPDFELTDIHLDQLFYFDLASFQIVLKDEYFTPQTVMPYIRELFDNFRQNGGDPMDWLNLTFESVTLNPQNYRTDLITTIEKMLIDVMDNFTRPSIIKLNKKAKHKTETLAGVLQCEPEKAKIIIDSIKTEYKGVGGKQLKLLSIAMQKVGLLPEKFNMAQFYRLCESEFSWDIASPQAVNDYIFSPVKDAGTLNEFTKYLKTLI